MQSSDPTPTRPARPVRVRLVVAVVGLLAAGAAAYYLWFRSGPIADDPPPDPRRTFDTPFRNARPDVAYVGDAACAPCHAAIDHSYHKHPMGRSAAAPDPTGLPVHFTAFGRVEFRVEARDGKVIHTEVVPGPAGPPPIIAPAEVVAVVGSGTRGKSFLCARDGSLWQSGVSWYSEKPGWDASPNFWPGRHARRPILAECLFCHINAAEPIVGSVNRFHEPLFAGQLAIGCERCHGPGAIHVAERTAGTIPAGPIDTGIVNPRHLAPDLREDVCRQCHLQGETRLVRRGRGAFDYRPGLPLDQFVTAYVKHPAVTDYRKSVGQVEQTAISKCATGSGGRFGCTSCHDPHLSPEPAARDGFYRARCLSCHQDKGCSLPVQERQASGDACTACHMPRAGSSNIVHTAVTDHRILRRPDPGPAVKGTIPAGELPLTTFGGAAVWPADPERERDLAVAFSRLPQGSADTARPAADRLQTFVARHRGDVEAWEALAAFRLTLGDTGEALKAAERAVAARPDRERALAQAAECALRAGQADRAEEFARKARGLNPGDPEHRYRLVVALIDLGRFADAEAEVQGLLAITPNHPPARAALAVCGFKLGRVREARAELDRAAALNPADGPDLRNWFSARTR